MRDADYYRDQAAHMRKIAALVHQRDLREMLDTVARDYDDIVVDIESGAIEIRHPELMPKRRA